MTAPTGAMPPAFYAASAGERRHGWADWWLLLHPPYTAWHLSYVAIGAALAPTFDGGRLIATLLAFLLAVGVGAHALDELHGRPLGTTIPGWALVVAAAASVGGAVVLGLVGVARIGAGLLVFIVVGVALNCAYNLELARGRFHTDTMFALAWGAFPVLTAFYAQAATIGTVAVLGAVAAFWLSVAQRSLSTPARALRRRVVDVDGTIVGADGQVTPISRHVLLDPIERALKAMTWGVVSAAVTLVLFRVRW